MEALTTATSALASATGGDQPRPAPLGEPDLRLLTPATVLLYVALVVGVVVFLVFLFFTFRYFVRAKYGLHLTSLRRHQWGGLGDAEWAAITHHREYLVHQLHQRFLTRSGHLITPRGDRRRRLGFAKMKKLTPSQVEALFPARPYKEWLQNEDEHDLDNGAENDAGGLIVVEESAETDGDVIDGNLVSKGHVDTTLAACGDSGELHFDTGGCAICLDPFEDDDVVRGLLCGHPFHADCLDPWLTRRRACCPMCKRDYYQKETEADAAGNDARGSRDLSSEFSIDLDAFRDDPDVRAMLHQLIPPESRVRHLLEDPAVQRLGIEAEAEVRANKKYGGMGKRAWWKLMGISKRDIFNWEFLELYHSGATTTNNTGEEPNNTTNRTPSPEVAVEMTELTTTTPIAPAPVHVRALSPEPLAAMAAARVALVQNRV